MTSGWLVRAVVAGLVMSVAGFVPAQAAPARSGVVLDGPARFEVLTPTLIRLEYAGDDQFQDGTTFNVVNRNFPTARYTTDVVDGWREIRTDRLVLRYRAGSGPFTSANTAVTLSVAGRPVTANPTWPAAPGSCAFGSACQAEDGQLTGGESVNYDHTGYTGRGFAADYGQIGASVAVTTPNAAYPTAAAPPPVTQPGQLGGWTRGLDSYPNQAGTNVDDIQLHPGLLNQQGWALLDDTYTALRNGNSWPTPRPDHHGAACQDGYFFGYGHDYQQALKDLRALTGPADMLPEWAFGVWFSTQGSSYLLFANGPISWGAPFDGASFQVDSWSDTKITFTVPEPSGTGGVWHVTPGTTATVDVNTAGGASANGSILITG